MSKKQDKRPDKAIIIALIGLAATVIAALLASPLLPMLFEKTPVPTDVTQTTGSATLIFQNDFESGQASGFAFSSEEWQVMKDRGNSVLELSGTGNDNGSAVFGPNDFSDGAIEFQLNYKNFGGFILTFRSSNNQTYTLYLSPDSGEIKLGFGSAANNWDLEPFENGSTRPLAFNEGVWYKVRLEAMGDQMTVWVDENRLLSSTDSRLQQGGLEFSVQPEGTVLLDNVKVWER